MYAEIKNKIDAELARFIKEIDCRYSLSKISPLLFDSIKDFVSREGKRVRPVLFILGYKGFSGKNPKGLYRSAISVELLHDFFLIHDDIIDRSDTRRGKPSMHVLLDNYLKKNKYSKCTGQDLAIVVGDVIYAMAIEAFFSIKENPARKESALKKYIEGTVYTGAGELEEVLYEVRKIDSITKEDIYKIYDLKTAYYTFACPLVLGALLAGAGREEVNRIFKYGICLGRAFQIKDDILGVFGKKEEIGKSPLTDIQEGKKTILVWYAYNHSDENEKSAIERILGSSKISHKDFLGIKKIISESYAVDYAKKEIAFLIREAEDVLARSQMRNKYKKTLTNYIIDVLK
jgi:geranylgeranyl diphosphate synthase type I